MEEEIKEHNLYSTDAAQARKRAESHAVKPISSNVKVFLARRKGNA